MLYVDKLYTKYCFLSQQLRSILAGWTFEVMYTDIWGYVTDIWGYV